MARTPVAGPGFPGMAGLAREWFAAGGSLIDGARLLLVEDEPDLAEVLALHLRGAGFAVDVAGDGLAALAALERTRPDVVLLDLTLPHLSGFRLLQLLRRDEVTAAVPVLVLTALSFQEAVEVARLGADDFLTKPVAPSTVVDRTRRLLAIAAPAAPAAPAAGEPSVAVAGGTTVSLSAGHGTSGAAAARGLRSTVPPNALRSGTLRYPIRVPG
jgi:DNA-binding response OmpR family regulator